METLNLDLLPEEGKEEAKKIFDCKGSVENGCNILYSEDMQHKQVIDDKLTIINPFV